jgi:TRAP-type C4-dicarboxylate transport system substrate-binding protein
MSKFNSTPDLNKEELLQAMLKTGQFQRREYQKAANRIRQKLKAKNKT